MDDRPDLPLIGAPEALAAQGGRLVDLIDGLLECGVVLRGEARICVAGIDLIFLGIDLVLADPETMRRGR